MMLCLGSPRFSGKAPARPLTRALPEGAPSERNPRASAGVWTAGAIVRYVVARERDEAQWEAVLQVTTSGGDAFELW